MNASEIRLGEAGVADLDAVMEVMEDSFDPRFGEAWTAPQFAGLLPMPGVWLVLAREGADAVGFALARIIADEAELLLLAVRRDSQCRGIGKMLLRRFETEAKTRGATRLHLEVRQGNHAVKLYEDTGFRLVGRRRNYYSGHDGCCYDALTLAKGAPGRD
ncbi:MAG TPA: ribosomal protein S18-alanine N-acetyltransferase [Allosphingosinicella sp.]|nr:ribosomal protein S18-alanine N-acetyltransferase [Allosphingosinicella sp.]